MSEKPGQNSGTSPQSLLVNGAEKERRRCGSETSHRESDVVGLSNQIEERVEDLVEDEIEPPTAARSARIRRVLMQAWNWKPKPARYDLNSPPEFTIWLNLLFAWAAGVTVANLYYSQAILNRMADTFRVSFERVSSVATLMQAGYAGGLLLICPLGDVFPRRPFILALVAFTATIWIVLCVTTSFVVFAAVSFLAGLTTVAPQLLLPLVGELAPPRRRATCLAVVVSGLALGMLVARILSGVLAGAADASDERTHRLGSWRAVYWFGLAAQWFLVALLYVWMPDYPNKNPGPGVAADQGADEEFLHGGEQRSGAKSSFLVWLSRARSALGAYLRILIEIGQLLITEPLLAQAAAVAFLLSAVLTSFWTTLSFLLSNSPYNYSSVVIGLFGLTAVALIILGPVYSRLVIDRVVPLVSALISLSIELAGVAVGTFTGTTHVAGRVAEAVAIDLGGQFTQIANRAAIYGLRPNAQNQINTAYMVVSFSGQLTGTAVGNRLYAMGGWVYSGSCNVAFIGLALLVCLARGPKETGWIGWSGGWAIHREGHEAQMSDGENPPEETQDARGQRCL